MKILALILLSLIFFVGGSSYQYNDPLIPLINKIINQESLDYSSIDSINNLADLQKLRNAIYAHYGYKFKNPTLTQYFEKYNWYKPVSSYVDDKLTSYDKDTISTIIYAEIKIKQNIALTKVNTRYSLPLSSDEIKFIGIWQGFPVMASGWGDCFAFFQNRKVIFRTSQMDGEGRLKAKIGYWMISDSKIHIEYFIKYALEGGKLVESYGSIASPQTLEGAILTEEVINPVEICDYSISKIEIDPMPQRSKLFTVKLDGSLLWKMRNDPNDYQ